MQLLFWILLAATAWTYLGYPLLLAGAGAGPDAARS